MNKLNKFRIGGYFCMGLALCCTVMGPFLVEDFTLFLVTCFSALATFLVLRGSPSYNVSNKEKDFIAKSLLIVWVVFILSIIFLPSRIIYFFETRQEEPALMLTSLIIMIFFNALLQSTMGFRVWRGPKKEKVKKEEDEDF